MMILFHVKDHLSNGLLVTRRGIMYYYCHLFGKDKKGSFSDDLKKAANQVNVASCNLYLTEPNTLVFGNVIFKDRTSGKEFVDPAWH